MALTKKQIEELKAKHGALYEISVDGYSCIFRKPNRKDLSYVAAVKNPMQMNETLMNQLWVDGDEAIRKDDDLFLAASAKLGELIEIKEAEIKKL